MPLQPAPCRRAGRALVPPWLAFRPCELRQSMITIVLTQPAHRDRHGLIPIEEIVPCEIELALRLEHIGIAMMHDDPLVLQIRARERDHVLLDLDNFDPRHVRLAQQRRREKPQSKSGDEYPSIS